MKHRERQELESRLARIDGRGYKAYAELRGAYTLEEGLTLDLDHVQGDPFAEPSRVRLTMAPERARYAAELLRTEPRRRAIAHRMLRAASHWAERRSPVVEGSGGSGRVVIDHPGQELLRRSASRVDDAGGELRLRVGLPARGRRVLASAARVLLVDVLRELARSTMPAAAFDTDELESWACVAEDQVALREQLGEHGLVAFLGAGSVLARRSGVDARPLDASTAVPLAVPPSLAATLLRPNGGPVSGLAIREGITVIVGGGFHGKSTLLRALTLGVYDHEPGDGRECCVTRADAVKVRAEDGRSISRLDISAWMGPLPGGADPRSFATANASGSTSQVAAIEEALEAGSRLLLIDEDTSATNFMIRDTRMRELIPPASEPIVPLVDRLLELKERLGLSVVIVTGGASDYLDVADQVIQLDAFRPRDVSERARALARQPPRAARVPRAPGVGDRRRSYDVGTADLRRGQRERCRAVSRTQIEAGRSSLDLAALEQLVDVAQTRAIADAISWLVHSGTCATPHAIAEEYERMMHTGGFDVVAGRALPDRAEPRAFELLAALARWRALCIV